MQNDRIEKANTLTHVPGIFLALIGTPFLIREALLENTDMMKLIGIWIFGISMLMVYSASVLYHSVRDEGRKLFCRKLDHIAIYFLIAGTHTPIIVKYLSGISLWAYLIILWGLAIAGIIGKIAAIGKWPKLSLALYLAMGWMFVFVLPFIWKDLSAPVLLWIAIGGLAYSLGAIFYARKKPEYFHAIWHLFVVMGSAGHFVAVWKTIG